MIQTIVFCFEFLLKLEKPDFTVLTHVYLQYRVIAFILV